MSKSEKVLAAAAHSSVLGEAEAVIEAASKAPGPDATYDLLALSQALRRLRPGGQGDSFLQKSREALSGFRKRVLLSSLDSFSPSDWVEAVVRLWKSYDSSKRDDPFTPEFVVQARSREQAARELLFQIDDAGLVLTAARAQDVEPDSVWAQNVRQCQDYVETEPELFYEAGDWAGVMRNAFRTYGELQRENRDLARTVEILELVADAYDSRLANPDIEVKLTGPEPVRLDHARITRPAINFDFAPVAVALAAAAAVVKSPLSSQSASSTRLEFSAKDRSWSAFLDVPAHASPQSKLQIRFSDRKGLPLAAGEAAFCGHVLKIKAGLGRLTTSAFNKVWNNPAAPETLKVRIKGKWIVGVLKPVR